MYKKYIILYTVCFIVIVTTIFYFEDRFYERPQNKFEFTQINIRKKSKTYETIKTKKDRILKLNTDIENNQDFKDFEVIYLYKNLKNIKVYKEPNKNSSFFILPENGLFEINAESFEYYKINFNSNTFFIKKTDYSLIKQQKNIYTNFIKTDGQIKEQYINLANTYWNKIPLKVRKKFVDNNWNIYVTDKNLAKEYNNSSGIINGITIYNKKEIHIQNTFEAISKSLIHEVGHFFDDYNRITISDSFNTIYQKEYEKFFQTYHTNKEYAKSDIKEYFAEAFVQYIITPTLLKENTKETFDYIEKSIKQ